MSIKTTTENNLIWINIDTVNDEAVGYLKNNYKFHHLDYDDLQGESQTPKVDIYNNYLFLVFLFPHWEAIVQKIKTFELDIFIGDDYLITATNTRSKEVKEIFYRCVKNPKIKASWMGKTPGYLLYKIMDALFHNAHPILNHIGEKISQVENQIYASEQSSQIVKQLASYRRDLLRLRRIIDPQRYVIANLSHIQKPFLDETMPLYFDDIHDYLNKLWSITETYKDTVDGLHVTIESLISHRTNKIISTLTTINVAMLPLNLLAGLYGMNIDKLPFAHQPFFVWMFFIGLAIITLIVLFLMHQRRRV